MTLQEYDPKVQEETKNFKISENFLKKGNCNYKNGRAKEYRVMNRLRKEGYDIVTRNAGSHGVFDIFAMDTKRGVIRLIQCKPKSLSENARRKIYLDNKHLEGNANIKFEVE
jgi:Holliday junction resolvase